MANLWSTRRVENSFRQLNGVISEKSGIIIILNGTNSSETQIFELRCLVVFFQTHKILNNLFVQSRLYCHANAISKPLDPLHRCEGERKFLRWY